MHHLANAPTSTFLATAHPEASLAFYRDTLGLDFVEDSQWAIVFRLQGTELRISKVPELQPFPWTVLDWQVQDLDAAVEELLEHDVTFERFEGMDQDERGVWTVPDDGTRIAWFKDPDGNVLSVSQRS